MVAIKKRIEKRIGAILIENRVITEKDLSRALEIQKQFGGKIGNILINIGALTEKDLLKGLSEQFGLPIFMDVLSKDYEVITRDLNKSLLKKFKVCPVEINGKKYLLTNDPLNLEGFLYVEKQLKENFSVALVTSDLIELLLSSQEEIEKTRITIDAEDLEKIKELALDAPVIRLVNQIIIKAVEQNASDIHFEAFKDKLRVRFRVDGILRTVDVIPNYLKLPVITRLKLISKMDISETRLPQDGRISLRVAGQDIDIRASSLPTRFGESFVLRILKKNSIELDLSKLGFFSDQVEIIKKIVHRAYGIFLTTGPTGSGKTTTLYSIIRELNKDQFKIITVEDPVEYELVGVNQVNVNPEINLTFSNVLRNILRQDPDIILVGEIRDQDTAEIATQAALTGHLVLSTLHTNNAVGAIDRLRNLNLPLFLIKNAVIGIMAQRLVRTICPHCGEKISLTILKEKYRDLAGVIDKVVERYVEPERIEIRLPKGCPKCNFTGYSGRTVIAEVLEVNPEFWIKYENIEFLSPSDLNKRTMFEDGILKVLLGKTTLDEVIRVSY